MTNFEYRLAAVETALTQIWRMLQNTLSTEKLNRIETVRQKQIEQIQTRVTALVTSISDLEDRIDQLS